MFCFPNKKKGALAPAEQSYLYEPVNQICRAFAESRSTEARVKKSRLLFVPLFHVNKQTIFDLSKMHLFLLSI